MIDDGSRGWHDWYRLNWDHPPLWQAVTRKLKDPKWRGPDGARLVFEIRSETDNTLVIKFNCNAWGAFAAGQPAVDYIVVTELRGGSDWQTVSVGLDELTATDPNITTPLANWQTVTEFSISPSGEIVRDGQKQTVDGQPWRGPRHPQPALGRRRVVASQCPRRDNRCNFGMWDGLAIRPTLEGRPSVRYHAGRVVARGGPGRRRPRRCRSDQKGPSP